MTRTVDFIRGGPGGAWGGNYLWCNEVKIGKLFDDTVPMEKAVYALVEAVETRLGESVLVGTIFDAGAVTGQRELITDDYRVAVVPKPKKKRKSRYEPMRFDWGDKE